MPCSRITCLTPVICPITGTGKVAAAAISGVSLSLILGICFSDDFYWFMNDLLTNRVFIWDYYISSVDNFFIGSHYEYGFFSELVSDQLSYFLSRGVAEHYGAHSTLVKYFFELGFLGLASFVIVFLLMFFRGGNSPIISYPVLIVLFTSTTLGHPSFFGLLVLIAVFYDERKCCENIISAG
jgi:hypothetical protein